MTAMFSKMMATMAGKVGAPMGLLTNQDDIEKLPAPDDKTMRELLGDSFNSTREGFDKVGEAFSNPGAYAMQTVQPGIDAVRGLVQDPAAYAEQRIRMAMNGELDPSESEFAKRDARMQAFMDQSLSDYDSAERAVQLPTGYFNTAQRGLM
jgi:hypothetical protein